MTKRNKVPEEAPFLCAVCPGRSNSLVDFEVTGFCPRVSVDSFRQARRYKLEAPEDYTSDQDIVDHTVDDLRYFDEETGEWTMGIPGHREGAALGVQCANHYLAGICLKDRDTLITESQFD